MTATYRFKKPKYISLEDVEESISDIYVGTIFNNTTIVKVVLKNGFSFTERYTFKDEKLYNQEIGKEICLKKLKKRIRLFLSSM